MYRLVVDFPLGEDQARAIEIAKKIADLMATKMSRLNRDMDFGDEPSVMQYRLQEDTDRTAKNYLIIDENGHAGRKKISVDL